MDTKELATELADAQYGSPSVVPLDDGRLLRATVEPDQDTSLDDFDFYGKTAPVRKSDIFIFDQPRPEGFDGKAEKLWTMENGAMKFWWQPPKDVKPTDEGFDQLRYSVRYLATFGFSGVRVELLDGEDAYGKPIVREEASLWGIDLTGSHTEDRAYVESVIAELLGELDHNMEVEEATA